MKNETGRRRVRRSFLTLCLLCAAAVLAIVNVPAAASTTASSDMPTAQHPASSILRTFLR